MLVPWPMDDGCHMGGNEKKLIDYVIYRRTVKILDETEEKVGWP